MATGWNYTYGDNWYEYIQRITETRDEKKMYHASRKAMLGAISEQTTLILGGKNSPGLQSHTTDDGFGPTYPSVHQGIFLPRFSSDHEQVFWGAQSEDGTAVIGGAMDDFAADASGLNASFQWGFGHMIAQMGGMSDSLKELNQIAKIPAQTAAYEQFEIARDAFRQGLFVECLEALDKAINGDHTSPGYKLEWRFHQLQGVIRLGFYGCDPSLIDPARAEKAFLLAARYARMDAPQEAARALLAAGWSDYVQGRLLEAWNNTKLAFTLDRKLTEALFQLAKITMAAGDPQKALPVLRKAIDRSHGYVLKAAADGDFRAYEKDLNEFLEALRLEAFNALTPKIWAALDTIEEWGKNVRSAEEKQQILEGWRSLLEGEWGLLDLLRYLHDGEGEYDPAKDDASVGEALHDVQIPYPDSYPPVRDEHQAPAKAMSATEQASPQPLQPASESVAVTAAPENADVQRTASPTPAMQPRPMKQAAAQPPKKDNREELERKRNTWHFESRTVKVTREVKEPCKIEEEYFVNVVVRPKTLFIPAVIEPVKKTRMVDSTRKVQIEDHVQTKTMVNELGETRRFPWKHFTFNPIPAGTFIMGSPSTEKGRSNDETLHTVTISKPFEMMIYPVTQALWETIMSDNPSASKGADKPVEMVSWEDAQRFIKKLNELFGSQQYWLPTEAQWEYACRAGTTTPFWTGENLSTSQANFNGNYPYLGNRREAYRGKTTPVGIFGPNPWGLYDMHGNVYEWCQDWHGEYPTVNVNDPVVLSGGTDRVLRGGAWSGIAQNCRSAFRNFYNPEGSSVGVGFRLCRSGTGAIPDN